MLLFDTCLFNGENIMKLRLNYLYPFVDRFFICEKRYTYQGKRKEELYVDLCKEWFAPFQDKITVIVDESEPFPEPWENEYHHRRYAQKTIQEYTVKCELQEHPNVSAGSAGADITVSCNSHFRHGWRVRNSGLPEFQPSVPLERAPNGTKNEPYLTIVADVDEIPNMEMLHAHREALYEESKEGIVILNQLQYYYNLHWLTFPSAAAFLISDVLMKKEPDFQLHRAKKGSVSCEFDCGWHFSFFMTREEIRRKIESFAHSECNQDAFKTDEKIDQCLMEGKDLFDREGMNRSMKREDPTPNHYPAAIYDFHTYIKTLQENPTKKTDGCCAE